MSEQQNNHEISEIPQTKYRPVYRCSNCGNLVDENVTECPACSATLGDIEGKGIKIHDEYLQHDRLIGLLADCPNGKSKDVYGFGGIGSVIPNHHIPIGVRESDNLLTLTAIGRALTMIRMVEECFPNVMIVHPFQMCELLTLTMEGLISPSEDKMSKRNDRGMIGYFLGMQVLVTTEIPAGKIIIFDSDSYESLPGDRGDAIVVLHRGMTRLVM